MKKLLTSLAMIAISSIALADPITFTASVTNANGTLNTTLNWNAPGARLRGVGRSELDRIQGREAITTSSSNSSSVTLTVNPIPGVATNVTVS